MDEVHKIAILDLRLLNLDRNLCNILVCCEKGSEGNFEEYKLVPIDHGLSIPDTLAINSYELAWLSFEQANLPFSQKSLNFISELDAKKDVELLQQHLPFRSVCLRNMRISSTLLKIGSQSGLTLAQIGQILCRPDDDDSTPSQLEQLVNKAAEMASKTSDSELSTSPSPEKKPLDDWEMTSNTRTKDELNPFTQILFSSIGDGANSDMKGRDSRVHTTENFDWDSELKEDLGRQKEEPEMVKTETEDGPWDEDFFRTFEVLLKDLVSTFTTKEHFS